ncbi:hypothetical protein [Haloarchaeobius salinus]|uniref:hypothetical protein n=1 Tax=Haloarchaeobius salinus TaxID=1198298 RepID=UPI0021090E9D|nr:hypothetical protein [Haloarchaeobius salinus]
MQAAFLVTGVMFTTIGAAASVGGDGALWGSCLALGIVFLTLGLVLAEEDFPGDDATEAGTDERG